MSQVRGRDVEGTAGIDCDLRRGKELLFAYRANACGNEIGRVVPNDRIAIERWTTNTTGLQHTLFHHSEATVGIRRWPPELKSACAEFREGPSINRTQTLQVTGRDADGTVAKQRQRPRADIRTAL